MKQVRQPPRSNSHNHRRFANSVISAVLDILETHHAKLVARVYVKPIGQPFHGSAVYTSTVQSVCATLQEYLSATSSTGIVIADSRNKGKNVNVSHSVFTQRYRAAGDPYPLLMEVPTFGHSDNHSVLQLTDLVCSALLFPIAAQKCSSPHLTDLTHVSPHYTNLASRHGQRLKDMQFRYQDANARWRGGITLIDMLNKFNAVVLFS